MSTTLKTLQGRIEVPSVEARTSSYIIANLHLESFSGGTVKGHSLQLGFITLEGEPATIQLDNANVKELIEILTETYLPS